MTTESDDLPPFLQRELATMALAGWRFARDGIFWRCWTPTNELIVSAYELDRAVNAAWKTFVVDRAVNAARKTFVERGSA